MSAPVLHIHDPEDKIRVEDLHSPDVITVHLDRQGYVECVTFDGSRGPGPVTVTSNSLDCGCR
jgi:hypothetical protein